MTAGLSLLDRLSGRLTPPEHTPRHAGLRIEDDRLTLVVARLDDQGTTEFHFDQVTLADFPDSGAADDVNPVPDASDHEERSRDVLPTAADRSVGTLGWLSSGQTDTLRRALILLKQRHGLGRVPLAVSLSGDFCVTRIVSGPTEAIDRELASLLGRVPRYLQLGPGGKVTGQARETIAPGIEHALTAVGNARLVQSLYECFRDAGLDVQWIEPSLVTLARWMGLLGQDHDEPILIADCLGRSWEVGISYQGRLALDYRPAAAHHAAAFADVLKQHMTRLRRFCQRHRGMSGESLERLFVACDNEKLTVVLSKIAGEDGLTAHLMGGQSPQEILRKIGIDLADDKILVDHSVPAIDAMAAMAAILPALRGDRRDTIPDLLDAVHRQRDRSPVMRYVVLGWPAMVAAALLAIATLTVSHQRRLAQQTSQQRVFVQQQMRSVQTRMARLHGQRELISIMQSIDQAMYVPVVSDVIQQVAQCLPPSVILSTIRIDGDQYVFLEGVSEDEGEIYEIVTHLQSLPLVNQVALMGTNPGTDQKTTQFQIRMGWAPPGAVQLDDTRVASKPSQEAYDG